MNKKQYKISPEIKTDILKRVKEDGIPVAQAATEHGIHESTIYNWLGSGIQAAPSWTEFAKLQKQNKELFALIGELTVQLSTAQKKS